MAKEGGAIANLLVPLGAALARPPVCCTAEVPLGKVLAAMHEQRVGSMPVVDARSVPVGIFTTTDVLECLAPPQVPLDTEIGRVMTRNPVTLDEEATLADAALAMSRYRIRHVLVTREARLTGVVSQRDLFALQLLDAEGVRQRLREAETRDALAGAAAAIRDLARRLVAHGLGAEQLTALVSGLNDELVERAVARAAARHRLPHPWCWLVLGSQGRREQVFPGDQDNALLIVAEGLDAAALAPYLAFAREVNEDLAACGFPLCDAGMVASNPGWCRSLRAWEAFADRCIAQPDAESLVKVAALLDARPVAGDVVHARLLGERILARAAASASFCRTLAQGALRARPRPAIVTERRDLKSTGLRVFANAARALAVAAARPETSTAARLRALAESGLLCADDAASAADAFHLVQSLRLKQEALGEYRATPFERRMLKEALEQAVLLQHSVREALIPE